MSVLVHGMAFMMRRDVVFCNYRQKSSKSSESLFSHPLESNMFFLHHFSNSYSYIRKKLRKSDFSQTESGCSEKELLNNFLRSRGRADGKYSSFTATCGSTRNRFNSYTEEKKVGRKSRKNCLDGLKTAVKHAKEDANLLARQFLRMDERAKKDVALLEERARKDTGKLDYGARMEIERLRLVALGLEESFSIAAEKHWNDGKLEADLRLTDLRARRRALEDTYAAVQVVRMVHNAVVDVLLLREVQERSTNSNFLGFKNSQPTQRPQNQPWETLSTTDRLLAFEDAYREMLNCANDVERLDELDSDELEFIVAALVDLDEVGGANGASLVAEAVNSPDVETRRALADALASAPSVWALGNAGIGALQRLANDSNPAVAEAATLALEDLERQINQQSTSLLKLPPHLQTLPGAQVEEFLDESSENEKEGK